MKIDAERKHEKGDMLIIILVKIIIKAKHITRGKGGLYYKKVNTVRKILNL